MRKNKQSAFAGGLAKDRLGVSAVIFFVVAAAAPFTVIGAMTTGYAVTNYTGFPTAYMAVLVILLVFSAGFVAMSRHVANAGAFYSYIARGLGRPAGVASALVALMAYNLMTVGLVGGFGAVASLILSVGFGVELHWLYCALFAWALIAVCGLLRVDLNGKVLAILLCAEIAAVLLFDAVLFTHPHEGIIDTSPLSPANFLMPGGIAAIAGALASFVGFEATVVFAEESKRPRRTIPLATYLAVLITGTIYVLSAWALPVATGVANIHEEAVLHETQLIFELVLPYVGQSVVDVAQVLFLTSIAAGALAFHNVVARYLFALGREGVLFSGLGRAGRTSAPTGGSLVQSGITLIALLAAALAGLDPAVHLLFWLTVLGGFGVLLLMAATCVSVIGFFARNREAAAHENLWRRIFAPALATLVLAAVVAGCVAQFNLLLGVESTNPASWMMPSAYGVLVVIGLVWALALRVGNRDVYRAIGLGAHSTLSPAPRSAPITAVSTVDAMK